MNDKSPAVSTRTEYYICLMFNVESLELHWSLDSQSIDQTSSSLSSSTNIRMMIVWFVLLVQGVGMFHFITRKWINSCFGPGCKDPVFRWHSLPWCKYRLNHLIEISGCMSSAWMLCEDFFHWMNKIRMLILNENTVCVPGCFSQGLLASCWCWQLRPESGKKPGFNPLLAEVCRKQKLQSENWRINEVTNYITGDFYHHFINLLMSLLYNFTDTSPRQASVLRQSSVFCLIWFVRLRISRWVIPNKKETFSDSRCQKLNKTKQSSCSCPSGPSLWICKVGCDYWDILFRWTCIS